MSFYKRHDIDSSIVAQAISRRGDSFGVSSNELIAAVGDSKIPRAEFDLKLRQMAQNTKLCHAIYYTESMRDPYCPVDRAQR